MGRIKKVTWLLSRLFCSLNNLSELRILTTFYFAKNDHQWVIFISLKTIKAAAGLGFVAGPPAGGLLSSVSLALGFR